jgi:hypothetical protein
LYLHVSKVLLICHNGDLPRRFNPTSYGKDVEAVLHLEEDGERLMPLAIGSCSSAEAQSVLRTKTASSLFPSAAHPDAALAGLWLYFSCFEEAHSIAQDIPTPEGSFWHGIVHRQEPDAANAAYWFRNVGSHAIFPRVRCAAEDILDAHPRVKTFQVAVDWDPFRFIDFCEYARKNPNTEDEQIAREIQRAEWQLLFEHCARSR